ncbi:MAG: hypothetical protein HQL46_14040, partial [Gammaproteobacteria bacterium]|nr:hypothetical protein [Gammaproteobacteria bacterium]
MYININSRQHFCSNHKRSISGFKVYLLIFSYLLLVLTHSVLAEQNCFEKTPQTSHDVTVNPSEYDSNHINYYFLKVNRPSSIDISVDYFTRDG